MDTESLVQPGRPFTFFETVEELAGILELPEHHKVTPTRADTYYGFWTNPQGERVEVAVKELKSLISKEGQADSRLKREVFVWSQITHPNLHPILGYRSQPQPRLISPWCHHGNVKDYLRANPGLSKCDKLRLLFQTAFGLEHLHSRTPPICHGDLKPENVLINDRHGPALSNFGLRRVLQGLSGHAGPATSEALKGTLRYTAGELVAGQKPSLESDVYAFGGLILTVMSGKAPFYGLADQVIIRRVMQDQPPKPAHHPNLPADDPLWTLIRRCWDKTPTARPTMREVLLELLGHMIEEQSNASSGVSLPFEADDRSGASSNMELDIFTSSNAVNVDSKFAATRLQALGQS
ncbi:hypothetical protein FS837_012078 [Tulasnella sp. UAMH 9824]|nr:hypothetical protein FS837_012078 [Tulasnella sp. UAMH 9824]